MNNKGFTLVEVLAVIVILAILITIAVPASISISNKIKTNMYCKKVDLIKEAAELYAQDNYDDVNRGVITEVSVKTLIETNYLKKDDKNATPGNGAVVSPRDNSNMDNEKFTILIKKNENGTSRKRATAVFNSTDYTNFCQE